MRWRKEITGHRLKVFGWGRENEAMTPDEETFALRTYLTLFGVSETVPVPTLDALALRVPEQRCMTCPTERPCVHGLRSYTNPPKH